MNSNAPTGLSDSDFEQLEAFLARASTLDFEGLLGVLHAVGVGPGLLVPSQWLSVVLRPSREIALPDAEVQAGLGSILNLYNRVLTGIEHDSVLLPEPDEHARCKSFAFGFVRAAELDPQWRNSAERFSLVAPFAYLAERFDLVPVKVREMFDADLGGGSIICEQMLDLIGVMRRRFAPLRVASREKPASAAAARTGRNEPCPCGSGRKSKRCCAA